MARHQPTDLPITGAVAKRAVALSEVSGPSLMTRNHALHISADLTDFGAPLQLFEKLAALVEALYPLARLAVQMPLIVKPAKSGNAGPRGPPTSNAPRPPDERHP